MYSCCPKDKQREVPSELIETWIPYQEGEMFLFSNENNDVDSLEIISIDKSFNKWGHWCGIEKEEIVANITGGSQFKKLRIDLNNHHIEFNLEIDDKHTVFDYSFDENKTNNTFEAPEFYSKIKLGNVNYNDVFGLKQDSVIVYYGKNNGIIGYKVSENTFLKN